MPVIHAFIPQRPLIDVAVDEWNVLPTRAFARVFLGLEHRTAITLADDRKHLLGVLHPRGKAQDLAVWHLAGVHQRLEAVFHQWRRVADRQSAFALQVIPKGFIGVFVKRFGDDRLQGIDQGLDKSDPLFLAAVLTHVPHQVEEAHPARQVIAFQPDVDDHVAIVAHEPFEDRLVDALVALFAERLAASLLDDVPEETRKVLEFPGPLQTCDDLDQGRAATQIGNDLIDDAAVAEQLDGAGDLLRKLAIVRNQEEAIGLAGVFAAEDGPHHAPALLLEEIVSTPIGGRASRRGNAVRRLNEKGDDALLAAFPAAGHVGGEVPDPDRTVSAGALGVRVVAVVTDDEENLGIVGAGQHVVERLVDAAQQVLLVVGVALGEVGGGGPHLGYRRFEFLQVGAETARRHLAIGVERQALANPSVAGEAVPVDAKAEAQLGLPEGVVLAEGLYDPLHDSRSIAGAANRRNERIHGLGAVDEEEDVDPFQLFQAFQGVRLASQDLGRNGELGVSLALDSGARQRHDYAEVAPLASQHRDAVGIQVPTVTTQHRMAFAAQLGVLEGGKNADRPFLSGILVPLRVDQDFLRP